MDVSFAIVELHAIHTLRYPDIMFVENGRPLHGSPMQLLTCYAMANLGIYGVSAHLILNGIAVTTCPIFHLKMSIRNGSIFRSEFIFHVIISLFHKIESLENTIIENLAQAWAIADTAGCYISESTVCRIVKANQLVTSYKCIERDFTAAPSSLRAKPLMPVLGGSKRRFLIYSMQ